MGKAKKEVEVKVKRLENYPVDELPSYATEGSSGFDLYADDKYYLGNDETKIIKTGLSMKIPEGYELQIRPRSGKSLKTPLRVANSPGTIDADYVGEIGIIMSNISHRRDYIVEKGEKIAQAVLVPVEKANLVEVDSLEDTKRGSGGFGSTDKI